MSVRSVALVRRLGEILANRGAAHLLAPVFIALGPYLHATPERVPRNARPVVEIALVRRLIELVGSTDLELVAEILAALTLDPARAAS